MHSIFEDIQRLTLTQGRLAGQQFTVLPWQARFVRGALVSGCCQTAALSVARGNGKSTLTAGIAAAALNGSLVVPRGETIICASSFSQARIVFEHILAFLGDELEDRRRWRIWDSVNTARIECRQSGASVRCIGSDPRRAHGLAPQLTICDEPAQWPETTGERMLAALKTAAGKQTNSKFLAIGTKPASPTHWFTNMLNGNCDYAQCHAAGENDPPFQVRTWRKANPSLKAMPDLEKAIRNEAKDARRNSSGLAAFRALRLNLGTDDTEQSMLIDSGFWESIEGDVPAAGQPIWGLDLGTSQAMSAVAAYWPESGRLECMAAFPGIPTLTERGLADGVGRLYLECATAGNLIQLGGRATDIKDLVIEAVSRYGIPQMICCDRWRDAELVDSLNAAQVPVFVDRRGMGWRDGSEDVRGFLKACLMGKVVPIKSLLLRSAISEARTVYDTAGNAKLAKNTQGGRRRRGRDDAAAAAILAVAAGYRAAARAPQDIGFSSISLDAL